MMFDVATMKIVKVVWTDCEKQEDGWLTEEEVIKYIDQPLKIMHSIGWLLCDDERWIIIAQSAGNDRDGFTAVEILKIPRAMINNVVTLTHCVCGEHPKTMSGKDHDKDKTTKPACSNYSPPPVEINGIRDGETVQAVLDAGGKIMGGKLYSIKALDELREKRDHINEQIEHRESASRGKKTAYSSYNPPPIEAVDGK